MNDDTKSEISRAIVAYLGKGKSSWPISDQAAVIAVFGAERGEQLVIEIKELLTLLTDKQPDWRNQLTLEASRQANIAALHAAHPELDDDALDAIGWTFTYWYR